MNTLIEKRINMKAKRFTDVVISTCGLMAFSPLMLIISVGIRLTSKGPAIFVQERAGICGKPFKIYKFRTMREGSEKETLGAYVCSESESLTHLGKFLRRWALDELPQLFNVIMGEMSIIGPRPTLLYQIEKYSDYQKKRLRVKPGLTGWAQVNGRNALTWPKRIELDVWYVENWSLLLDMKIMLMTIPALLRKDFAFAEENVEDDEIVRFEG